MDETGQFCGVVSLHDVKPYLNETGFAEVVVARDILHDDFPFVRPGESLADGLGRFAGLTAERLPVVDSSGLLVGSMAKGDLLLALVDQRGNSPEAYPVPAQQEPGTSLITSDQR